MEDMRGGGRELEDVGWGSQNGAGGVGQPPPTSPWALEYLIHQQMMTQTLPISLRRVLENAKLEKMLKRLTQQLQGFCGGGGGWPWPRGPRTPLCGSPWVLEYPDGHRRGCNRGLTVPQRAFTAAVAAGVEVAVLQVDNR